MGRLVQGDAVEELKKMPAGIAHCCVTSPPYFALRDYGVEGQIGLEETPGAFIEKLVHVFREVKRVLRDDGTLWLNIGDSYASRGGTGHQGKHGQRAERTHTQRSLKNFTSDTIKNKDLIGIPWMLAFALRHDGWYLRSDIIWAKPRSGQIHLDETNERYGGCPPKDFEELILQPFPRG